MRLNNAIDFPLNPGILSPTAIDHCIFQKRLSIQISRRSHTTNKSDLITTLSLKENLSEKNASDVVNLIFDCFTDTLKKGGRIEIRGFGSFTVREYGTYTGRNPKTGEKVQVGAKKLPFFKVGKELKKRVNGA